MEVIHNYQSYLWQVFNNKKPWVATWEADASSASWPLRSTLALGYQTAWSRVFPHGEPIMTTVKNDIIFLDPKWMAKSRPDLVARKKIVNWNRRDSHLEKFLKVLQARLWVVRVRDWTQRVWQVLFDDNIEIQLLATSIVLKSYRLLG